MRSTCADYQNPKQHLNGPLANQLTRYCVVKFEKRKFAGPPLENLKSKGYTFVSNGVSIMESDLT